MHGIYISIALSVVVGVVTAKPTTINDCGRSKYPDAGSVPASSRQRRMIVGGYETRPNEFPWQISLRRWYYYVPEEFDHACGGSILNSEYILTAAHCVETEPERLLVVVGEHDRYKEDGEVVLQVVEIKIHEGYEPFSFVNDIALLRVAEPIEFTENIQPVCLPKTSEADFTGMGCVVSGWGVTQQGSSENAPILRAATVPVIPLSECQAIYQPPMPRLSPDMLCAGDGYSADACSNDSGGPLACRGEDGAFTLAGVVSWGNGCAAGYPGVYANVAYFLDWIHENMD